MINQDIPDTIHETVIQSENLAKIGEWTHVAAQYDKDAGKIRLYVDGVLAGERNHTVSWNARGAFEIGHSSALDGPLKGAVDDIHVYQRALSVNELRALVGVPGTTSHNNIPSGQVLNQVFTLDNPASFKFVVKACRAGITPPSCNESPAYRITSDAPVLPSDTETGMADPTQPILSGMVNRPSGHPVTAKYYLYDSTGAPVGSAPLGSRTVNGGERASFQVPANTVQPGSTYKWQMVACVTAPQGEDPSPGPGPDPDPTPTPDPDPDPDPTPDPTPTPTPTPTGLVAAYGMNEGSGATVTDATGTNHGTAIDTSWVTGKYGKGLSFDGMFGLVTVDNHASLRLSSGMTLSAWVKPSSVDDWYAVMGKDYETIDDLSYGLHASDGFTPLGWVTTQGVPKEVEGTSQLRVNTWSHLAVTYDGSRARLYLNGNQIGEERVSGTIQNDRGDFHIGGNTIYGEYFDGVIDEVRVYNRAQTAAEISTDMNTPLAGVTSSVSVRRTTGVAAVTEDGPGREVCTSKTAPVSFTTPGTPPPPPAEDVRHITLGKDNFVIKTAKTDPSGCDGSPCTVTDSAIIRMGGTGVDRTAAVIGFNLDELPEGAMVSTAMLKLGTPACSTGTCPLDAVITAVPLQSAVTGETKGPDLADDVEEEVSYTLPVGNPQADVAGSQYQWLLLVSNAAEEISFGEAAASEQPSLALSYVPASPPSNVMNLVARGGDASATASWGLPENNGSIALLGDYDVEVVDADGAITKSMEVHEPFAAITGLANDVTYTIRVRARTAFGSSGWESTTATTRPVPPPPVNGGESSCVPFDEHSPAAASSVSGAQAYIDRVGHYYEAQDAVLEGRASTIWDAPGVDPRGANTASLSLLNSGLQMQRDIAEAEGQSRTNSTVTLSDVVVQAMEDGAVRVLAGIKREWEVPATNAAARDASDEPGTVEPMRFMLSIHVFERCGKMSIIQVPYDAEEDSTDFDPGLSGGMTSPPIKNGEYSWWQGDLGQERNSKTGKLRLGKNWYVIVRSYSEWKVPTTYDEWHRKWRLQNVFSRMDVYPATSAQYHAAYGTALMKDMKLKVESTVCFKTTTTSSQTSIGITLGTEAHGSFTQSFQTQTKWRCIRYKRTLGQGVKPALEAGVNWINSECQGDCSANFYRHGTTATLTVKFKGKDKLPHEEEVRVDLSCQVERMPPRTFGAATGSIKYPECEKGGTLKRPILED